MASGYRQSSPFTRRRTSPSAVCIGLGIAFTLLLTLFIYGPLPRHYEQHRHEIIEHVAGVTKEHLPKALTGNTSLATIRTRYAFATYLDAAEPDPEDLNEDNYFVAVRILAYQLLHAAETKSRYDYPFLVLVTPEVSHKKRSRLRQDGAIVVEAPPFELASWLHTNVRAWASIFSKLRLWELTQFERILLLDGDTILTRPLDAIFQDPAVAIQTTASRIEGIKGDEAVQPKHYAFASGPEMNREHHFPPSEDLGDWPNGDYFNAGFFVLQPSLELLDYYTSLMQSPTQKFDPFFMEQNLLNYAHRPEKDGGNMAWQHLSTEWNIHFPSPEDLKGGVASLHEKFWAPVNADLAPYLSSWRWRMEGHHEARDALLVR